MSTARVMVNPSAGNPFVPAPASVRQDELTSLETEAQVVRSTEVLSLVADQLPGLTANELARGLQVAVPANTQILQISYSSADPDEARQVTDAVTGAYLDNRVRRFDEVNAARIGRVETQTIEVLNELHAATDAAQHGSGGERAFQVELADALRNELVSLRAQRTALENDEAPAGSVIAPASAAKSTGELTSILFPVGGALAGVALGCLLATLLERYAGKVRSVREVELSGLPVLAAVPSPNLRTRLLHKDKIDAVDTMIRRLRASILELDPRPEVIAIAPAGSGESNVEVSEAVAESFARAGHRVVLVRTDGHPTADGLGVERGLAEALLYERLNVSELLQPTVEPLLSLLPRGQFTDQSRELMVADRLGTLLSPLVDEGHLVIIQSPGIDSAEGEACVRAADLGLVLVTLKRTRPDELEQVTKQPQTKGTALAALVLGRRSAAHHARPATHDLDSDHTPQGAVTHNPLTRARK
jgi:capsular polysaccharide biosynthesis protein